MARKMTLVIFMVSMMTVSFAQTFQYSRGWTNGKRGDHSPPQVLAELPDEFGGSFSVGKVTTGTQIVEPPTPCQLQKLKMLLRGNVGIDQVYLLPCEVVGESKIGPISDFARLGRFRRSSIPQENNKTY